MVKIFVQEIWRRLKSIAGVPFKETAASSLLFIVVCCRSFRRIMLWSSRSTFVLVRNASDSVGFGGGFVRRGYRCDQCTFLLLVARKKSNYRRSRRHDGWEEIRSALQLVIGLTRPFGNSLSTYRRFWISALTHRKVICVFGAQHIVGWCYLRLTTGSARCKRVPFERN